MNMSEFNFNPSAADDDTRPLADRMRPNRFDEVLGQEHVLRQGTLLYHAWDNRMFPSIIFWGPPGCGKTTIARLIAERSDAIFISLSAVSHATADLRKVFERAKQEKLAGKRSVLLVDEIHRFNRSQQDLFLPYIENGTITLIGATTENPSFELNSALLSRCKVLILNRLNHDALTTMIQAAERFTEKKLPLSDEAKTTLCALADGDGRYLLNMCEELFRLPATTLLDSDKLLALLQKRRPLYDKSQDGHYNLISALHKSMRGSDVNAALYWLARMLDGGDEPLYILRRLVRFASEDIGLADPQALVQAIAAKEAYVFLGSPEGKLAIAQAVIYLSTAPKSNTSYTAFKASMKDAQSSGSLMPPKHILNSPTTLMKHSGYGEGYIYDHDTQEGYSGQNYFPDSLEQKQYYTPVERGFEREIIKRLDYWKKIRNKSTSNGEIS